MLMYIVHMLLMFLFGNEFTLEAVALAPSLITEST